MARAAVREGVTLAGRAELTHQQDRVIHARVPRAEHLTHERTGAPRPGPHRLRHAVACDLLAHGASLEEIGQLLRHRSQRSTAIYAKARIEALRTLARPCPAAGTGTGTP
jgi:site-specific recombinase XerD